MNTVNMLITNSIIEYAPIKKKVFGRGFLRAYNPKSKIGSRLEKVAI
jgi:hypothetical protein